jgi:apoptosis-stimulating of p53 protein 1
MFNVFQLDAALEGELETVRKAVAELTDASKSNEDGITALHNAICAERFEVVKYLIEEAGADVNAADSDGWTPLHCAASAENVDIVRYLVRICFLRL